MLQLSQLLQLQCFSQPAQSVCNWWTSDRQHSCYDSAMWHDSHEFLCCCKTNVLPQQTLAFFLWIEITFKYYSVTPFCQETVSGSAHKGRKKTHFATWIHSEIFYNCTILRSLFTLLPNSAETENSLQKGNDTKNIWRCHESINNNSHFTLWP